MDNQNQANQSWYYAIEGVRSGPISRDELQNKVKSGELARDSVIWSEGMPSWITVNASDFSAYILQEGPPPLSVNHTNNNYIWGLATAPLWGTVCQVALTHLWAEIKGGWVFYKEMWWVVVICNILMSVLDYKALKAAGHNIDRLKGWMLAIVPVYIYNRDKLLGSDLTRFWIWIGAWIASLFML